MKYLLALALLLTACTTTQVQTFGPLVTEVAETRLTVAFLKKNPTKAPALIAVAAALETLQDTPNVKEITEAAIRAFIAKVGEKYALLPPESELLVQGLLAARDAALQQLHIPALRLDDPRIEPWIEAVRRGIVQGVAASQNK